MMEILGTGFVFFFPKTLSVVSHHTALQNCILKSCARKAWLHDVTANAFVKGGKKKKKKARSLGVVETSDPNIETRCRAISAGFAGERASWVVISGAGVAFGASACETWEPFRCQGEVLPDENVTTRALVWLTACLFGMGGRVWRWGIGFPNSVQKKWTKKKEAKTAASVIIGYQEP